MRVLITGAAGKIGSTLVQGMRDRYVLRGIDRAPMPDLEDAIVGDTADFDTMLRATEGMDAIIHLAGGQGEWEQVLNNISGTYNVLETARLNNVQRIAYASRGGVLPRSFYPRTVQRTVDLLPRPDSYYSVGKVFAENLGYMYSARFDMEFVAVRIGNYNPGRDQPEHPHHLGHRDCVQVFERAITHPGVKFEIVFGVSDSNWPLYDLDHGRKAIGYNPQERSELPESEWV